MQKKILDLLLAPIVAMYEKVENSLKQSKELTDDEISSLWKTQKIVSVMKLQNGKWVKDKAALKRIQKEIKVCKRKS